MKKLLCCMVFAVVFVAGCTKELTVTPASDVKVEYGAELDNAALFDAKTSDENVSVKSVEGFDSKKVGEQILQVTFSDGKKEKQEEVKVTVEDTKKPEITLKKDKVSITEGDKLTLKDNVKEVKDPVDGDLKYSDKKVEKDGYYIDKGKLDTKKAGTYEVTVIAKDKNGNEAKKSFKVEVKEKEEEVVEQQSTQEVTQQQSVETDNVQVNTTQPSTNNTQSTTPSQNQQSSNTDNKATNNTTNNNAGSNTTQQTQQNTQPVQEQQQTTPQKQECVFNGTFDGLGNSGKVFYSYDEAMAWGLEQTGRNGEMGKQGLTGFHMWTVTDNCGERNDVWTVHFYPTRQ